MRWIAVLVGLLTGTAQGQDLLPILSVRLAQNESQRSRLVELIGRITSDSSKSLEIDIDEITGEYIVGATLEPASRSAEIQVSVNAWRSVDPDAFEPGPMNALLGAFGLADARTIRVHIDESGDRLVARWDRRRDDPATTPVHETELAIRLVDESAVEHWRVEGLGVGRFIVGALRAGLAIEEGERSPSDRAFAEGWLRSRSTLLNSLERASVGTEVVITQDLHSAFVFRFDPAIKVESLGRASLRIVPNGIPPVMIRDRALAPEFAVAQAESGAVVVIAPTRADLDGVLDALDLEAISGGDGP
ncbi:MAG: hypothetical protein KDA31_06445 [Phycisphaerales bacterium]|nr:hypothetical protein [Phycisphaerales bacterium]MCB9836489.1 hypothetical protein [Phycisphaera sp.]